MCGMRAASTGGAGPPLWPGGIKRKECPSGSAGGAGGGEEEAEFCLFWQ